MALNEKNHIITNKRSKRQRHINQFSIELRQLVDNRKFNVVISSSRNMRGDPR